MSTDLQSKKRKSGDDVVLKAKKVKTTVPTTRETRSSAEKPAPLKSALKSKTTTAAKAKETKKSAKASKKQDIADAEELETTVSDAEDGGAELTADQTTSLLAGFSDTEDENSDADGDEDAIEISKLPAPPTAGEVQKAIMKIAKDSASDPESTPGVVYISRIPHGFYEPQMQAYFSQFGPITNIRLARNKKTGKSKHFAFIQFASASVAEIVAKTMDKYLLFGHLLQARIVPAEQVQENLWKGGKGVKGGKARPRNRIEGSKLRKGTDREGWEKRIEKEEKRRSEKAEKMKEMGYEFEMPGVKAVKAVPVRALKDVEAGAEEPVVEESVVEKIEPKEDATVVTVEKTTKRKGKGAAAASTVTKKRKTKVAA
jgi:nucleolar protein 15